MKKNKKQCFGVIIGTRAYFNYELARDVRKQLLKTLDAEGYDYVILPEGHSYGKQQHRDKRGRTEMCGAVPPEPRPHRRHHRVVA